jgi:hypothetical protein
VLHEYPHASQFGSEVREFREGVEQWPVHRPDLAFSICDAVQQTDDALCYRPNVVQGFRPERHVARWRSPALVLSGEILLEHQASPPGDHDPVQVAQPSVAYGVADRTELTRLEPHRLWRRDSPTIIQVDDTRACCGGKSRRVRACLGIGQYQADRDGEGYERFV